jgi:hypothetical protein
MVRLFVNGYESLLPRRPGRPWFEVLRVQLRAGPPLRRPIRLQDNRTRRLQTVHARRQRHRLQEKRSSRLVEHHYLHHLRKIIGY